MRTATEIQATSSLALFIVHVWYNIAISTTVVAYFALDHGCNLQLIMQCYVAMSQHKAFTHCYCDVFCYLSVSSFLLVAGIHCNYSQPESPLTRPLQATALYTSSQNCLYVKYYHSF